MDLNREPNVIGFSAAEEVRALNHATLDPAAFPFAGTVSDTANAIATLVQRLPQSCEQMSAGLRALEEQHAIRMADGSDVTEQVGTVLRALLNAQEALTAAHGALREATGPLSSMGGFFTDEDEDDAVDEDSQR